MTAPRRSRLLRTIPVLFATCLPTFPASAQYSGGRRARVFSSFFGFRQSFRPEESHCTTAGHDAGGLRRSQAAIGVYPRPSAVSEMLMGSFAILED